MNGDLSLLLRANDLAEFESILVENEVDLKTLKLPSESDLKELGLAFGPRKRFLNAMAALKGTNRTPESETKAPVTPAPRGERRHLTVMFCDLVVSTTLSERLDPEELHLLFKEYYKVCTEEVLRYEGYVHNLMGDGLLIYFGWPIAHEDSAERAVRSALKMVEAVKRIPAAETLVVRIGVATGSVIVGEASRDGRMEPGLVVGEIPNLAARLLSLAGPDEVVVAHSTRRLLRNRFVLTSLGSHSLKGFAQPVQVWRVDGALRNEGRVEAGNLAEAISLWRHAGILAVKRVALREAVAHFQEGLTLIHRLPPSPERDQIELTIREPLNAAWTGLRGWAADEVGENAVAALRLAERQDNSQCLMLAMWWVWTSTITQGKIADSQRWVERLLAQGRADGGIDLRIFGHSTAMVQHFLSGRLRGSRVHYDRALDLWEPKEANRWIQLTGFEMRTFVEVYACQLIWIMGFPDQAKRLSEDCVAYARSGGHIFNLVWALTFSAYVFAYRREPDLLMERVEEAERLAREQGLAFFFEVSVPQAKGIALLQQGRLPEAVAQLRQGIERWTKTGGNVRIPLVKSALAMALEESGDSCHAFELIQECFEQIESPHGQERLWLAEVLRRQASILMEIERDEEAEHLLRSALDCAREQKARSWELRSATTLAKLLARNGRRGEARILLAPVYDSFTEGWETRDLIDARLLLEALATELVN
jgi:class 3 adenylate cyclase